MADPIKERILTPTFDRKGNPEWKTTMSPPDDSIAMVAMVPDRIIPVIFVPGVMGSNLKSTDGKGPQWCLDSAGSMAGWLTRTA